MIWLLVPPLVLLAVIFGIRHFSKKRDPLGGYVRPDGANLIPNRAEREEAERRQRWLEDHPREIPPWEKLPKPKQ